MAGHARTVSKKPRLTCPFRNLRNPGPVTYLHSLKVSFVRLRCRPALSTRTASRKLVRAKISSSRSGKI
ncbi:hypothetical protein M413DRAFT_446002 [Hebeloma cylindrosporum]|uniref:Uncharacterized protein n=1 Tax=Hebeloma cylindrosporum TaxID=76867 RepID=A0A0C2YHM4_HEBCY|nr:hypothetical protein M413DRAFT_446002 [Hebeloma cylindrosporum h7]